MKRQRRFVEPNCDFPSGAEIERAAPTLAEIDRQISEIAAKLRIPREAVQAF